LATGRERRGQKIRDAEKKMVAAMLQRAVLSAARETVVAGLNQASDREACTAKLIP